MTTFTTAGNATSYTDSAVTAGTTYYYRVRAENVPGYSPWSDPSVSITVPAIPATPTNLRAVASGVGSGSRSINLTWAESAASTVTGFTINWALNAAFTTGGCRRRGRRR